MRRTFAIQAALAIALLAIGTATVASADNGKDGRTELKTRLAGGAIQGKTPEGNADFRSEPAKGRTRLNVEVEEVNLTAGTTLDVFVNGVAVGKITLSAFRSGELELNSEDGDAVPAVAKGTMVSVKHLTATILAGAF